MKIEILNLRILKTEPSSRQCSMISNGQRKEIQNNVFQIPKKSRSTRRNSREDTGRSVLRFLGTHEIDIQIPSTTKQNRTSWVVICRGKNRHVDELHLRDSGHNPTSSELLLERYVAKKSEPCSTEIPHRGNSCDVVQNSDASSKWNDTLAYNVFQRRRSFSQNLKIGHEIGSSSPLNPKKNLAMTYQNREKYTTTAGGKYSRRPSTGQRTTILADITNAIIVYNPVLANCIYKVTS